MENLVLFLQGNAINLEVIREAWMRRALRSPKGFVIKAVGDLSPIQMSPVSQSQFIPLAEVLCCAISDMNSSHTTVTQEALVNHMSKAHPGMTIPTQDILYNALGSLIKERKIYHTGEGYFIVTPQTYFITNSLVREKSWWTSASGDDPPSPPPITYLLSNEACNMDSSQTTLVAHCKSCSCFAPPQISSNVTTPTTAATVPPSVVPDQHSVTISISECTGKSLKWPRPSDHKPTLVHQSTTTAVDYQPSELSKTTGTTNATSRKDKESKDNKSGRKFGLSLFWRNGGKKEKPKKEYASFSGQFPPEEWPVRDEEDLNNLPRDLEHAIIKRINPELTVDNLTRHTVLMKKLEDRGERVVDKVQERGLDKGERVDRGVDKGISTEILAFPKPRHHHSSQVAGGRKSAPKAFRSKRRAYSSREKRRDREKEKERVRNKTHICEEEYPEEEDLIPSRLQPENHADEPEQPEEAGAVEGKCLYKKRIDNPFHTQPIKDTSPATAGPTTSCTRTVINNKENRRRETKEGRTSGSGRKERRSIGHRSKSWDPYRSKVIVPETEHAGKSRTQEDRYACSREGDLTADDPLQPDLKHSRELPSGYGAAYPRSSTLRIDDKVRHRTGVANVETWASEDDNRHLLESQPRALIEHRYHMEHATEEIATSISPYSGTEVILPTHPYDLVIQHLHDPVVPWPEASLQRKHSLRHADKQEDTIHRPDLLPSHQQACDFTANRGQDVTEANITVSGREQSDSVLFSRRQLTAESSTLLSNSSDFVEDENRLYQDNEEDEDACSSLYLNEDEIIDRTYITAVAHHHSHRLVYSDDESDKHYQKPHLQPHNPHHYHPQGQSSVHENWDSTHMNNIAPTTQEQSSLSPARVRHTSWSHQLHSQMIRSPCSQSKESPRRATLPKGETQQGGSLSIDLETPEAADSSIFDYCQTSEVESDAETVRKSVGEGDSESTCWRAELVEEMAEERRESVLEIGTPQSHAVSLSMPSGAGKAMVEMGESGESQSITGDSGIDSPRTRVSLASNNTVILEGLKKRGFLQNLEKLHSKSSTMRPQSSLLQLTPVMNV